MKNLQTSKILVIRLSSIGDIVLTTGFLRLLRKRFPESKIDFFTFRHFQSILEHNLMIDKLITCEKNTTDSKLTIIKNNIIKEQGDYDIIIDLQNNSVSNKFSQGISDKIIKYDKRRKFKLELVWLKKHKGEPYQNIHNIYLETLNEFAYEEDNLGLEFWLESDKLNQKYIPNDNNFTKKSKLNIVIAPGAHYKTKRWSYINFAHLIRKLKNRAETITLIGGLNDTSICNKIKELNPDIINLCGNTNLLETAELISKSDLLITNDTGVMHIATARKIPVVAFFGSTVRELGFEPYSRNSLIIESDVCCRPCSHIGRNFCPLIHFKCMNDITPDIAYNKIIKFIDEIYS
jgi:heptosyltransferase-2